MRKDWLCGLAFLSLAGSVCGSHLAHSAGKPYVIDSNKMNKVIGPLLVEVDSAYAIYRVPDTGDVVAIPVDSAGFVTTAPIQYYVSRDCSGPGYVVSHTVLQFASVSKTSLSYPTTFKSVITHSVKYPNIACSVETDTIDGSIPKVVPFDAASFAPPFRFILR